MSLSESDGSWGPSHQYRPPPRDGKSHLLAGTILFVLIAFALLGSLGGSPNGMNPISSILHMTGDWPLAFIGLALFVRLFPTSWFLRLVDRPSSGASIPSPPVPTRAPQRLSVGERVRAHSLRLGGGAYLGLAPGGRWVTADPEHAVMVLGPPRSGKTSMIVIPSILAAPGAVISTATKPDVMEATWRARSEVGQVWLFDPSGERSQWPSGIRRLSWSPVAAASTWDGALIMARAMAAASSPAKGTTNEHHWRERSTALLAPLLHAANITEQPISEVLRWVLRGDLDAACKTLEDHGADITADVLAGIKRTDERERSSIFSATAGVLAAYNADATRANAAHPNFDASRFAASTDTVYITAPAHKQALCAPLVVGLLEQIRHSTYEHAPDAIREGKPPVYLCLDEVANIAPIHDLPALVSEAGGQRLHVMACLQDLSQARKRWGEDTADGFLSLFQTKLILNGIADPKTLDAISLCLGEYDRQLVSHTLGRSETKEFLEPRRPTETESVTYHTQRQRTLSPGEIARLPPGRALHLQGTRWGLIRTTPWHRTEPWVSVARADALRSVNRDASSVIAGQQVAAPCR
jgi:type IV secretion system protein VirD4